jgi:hypothetical protein
LINFKNILLPELSSKIFTFMITKTLITKIKEFYEILTYKNHRKNAIGHKTKILLNIAKIDN